MLQPDTRCTFTYRDKRRCKMLRSADHPLLCLYHVRQAAKEGRELPPQLEPYMLARELDNPWAVRRAIKRIMALTLDGQLDLQRARVLTGLARLLLVSSRQMRKERRRGRKQPLSSGKGTRASAATR